MCSAPGLMMLYIGVMFYKNIWNGFQLTELTRVSGRDGYFQYLLRSKGGNSKSRLTLSSAHPLMVLYIWEKFHKNISNCFQLTEQTQVHGRNGYVQCSMGNNSKSRQTRVTVDEFYLLPHQALNLYEASPKYLKQFPTYRADTSTWKKWLFSIFMMFKGP